MPNANVYMHCGSIKWDTYTNSRRLVRSEIILIHTHLQRRLAYIAVSDNQGTDQIHGYRPKSDQSDLISLIEYDLPTWVRF